MKKKFVITAVLLCVLSLALFLSSSLVSEKQRTLSPTEKLLSSATIHAGESTLSVPAGISLYDALMKANAEGKVQLEGKKYPSLGFFVTRIGDLKEGNGKYLMYFINGTEASVGVSEYVLKDGDTILWQLK